MKLFKGFALIGALCLVVSSALRASDDDEVNRILAKYGIDNKSVFGKKNQSSLAGDLASTSIKNSNSLIKNSNSLPSKEQLQKAVKVGKELEKEVGKVDDKKLDRLENSDNDDQEDLEEIKKDAVDKKPGFFNRLFNFVPGIMKMTDAVTEFNKKAAENLTRFKVTFKNVSDSLVSFNQDRVLVPEKVDESYVFDKKNGAIKWKLVPNKLTAEQLQALKQECLYLVIKEMVDGFNHLDNVVGKGINALSYLAPNTAKQSVLIYEVATKFLPMLEKIAKESLDSSEENSTK